MPRTGGGTGPFVLNPVYLAVPGTTILATQHNTPLEDIEDTFNIPQPIAYGGTQGASAIEAMDNLFIVGADKASSASIDLDNVTGSFVNITGTTTVTSIALAEGAIRFARAVSALPITASASLIVNGSTTQAYTCEAGDQMMIVGYAAAVVRIWVQGRDKVIASQFKIADSTDQTKQVQFSASGLTTATTRTLSIQDANGTIITSAAVATKADQQTSTSLTTYVSPGRQQFHPSAAKGWVIATASGTANNSHNVISVTDLGVGVIEIAWDTSFDSPAYVPIAQPIYTFGGTAATTLVAGINNTLAAGTSRFTCVNLSTFLATDPSFWSIVAFGTSA